MTWSVTPVDRPYLPGGLEVHVYPTIDLADHRLTPFCWCRPCPEWGGGGLVWTHHEKLMTRPGRSPLRAA